MNDRRRGNKIAALAAAVFVIGGAFLTCDSINIINNNSHDASAEIEYDDSLCGVSEFTYVTCAKAETLPENEGIVIRSGDVKSNQLTITCNVDWGEDVIPQMLNVFKDKKIKVTFFVTGSWASKNPDLLRRMYAEGHEIQSHGYSHKLCSQVSEETVKDEIEKTYDVIKEIIGVSVNYFAPPSGDYDEKTIRICRELGYKMCLWTLDTIDWRNGSTSQVIYDRIMSKDLSGGIILMHPKQATLEALPKMIDSIRERGIDIVPLSELTI